MTNDVLQAIRTRRSIGKLGGEVSDAQIRTLVEAATWAPNHRVTEPWRFIVLRGAARERLGQAWANVLAQQTTLQGEEREQFLRREAQKAMRAPALIVVAARTDPDPIVAIEDLEATSAAVQNLLLAAQALELGAMWRTGDIAYSSEIKAHLSLEPEDRIVAIVYVGKAEMTAPAARPREIEERIRWMS